MTSLEAPLFVWDSDSDAGTKAFPGGIGHWDSPKAAKEHGGWGREKPRAALFAGTSLDARGALYWQVPSIIFLGETQKLAEALRDESSRGKMICLASAIPWDPGFWDAPSRSSVHLDAEAVPIWFWTQKDETSVGTLAPFWAWELRLTNGHGGQAPQESTGIRGKVKFLEPIQQESPWSRTQVIMNQQTTLTFEQQLLLFWALEARAESKEVPVGSEAESILCSKCYSKTHPQAWSNMLCLQRKLWLFLLRGVLSEVAQRRDLVTVECSFSNWNFWFSFMVTKIS